MFDAQSIDKLLVLKIGRPSFLRRVHSYHNDYGQEPFRKGLDGFVGTGLNMAGLIGKSSKPIRQREVVGAILRAVTFNVEKMPPNVLYLIDKVSDRGWVTRGNRQATGSFRPVARKARTVLPVCISVLLTDLSWSVPPPLERFPAQ